MLYANGGEPAEIFQSTPKVLDLALALLGWFGAPVSNLITSLFTEHVFYYIFKITWMSCIEIFEKII